MSDENKTEHLPVGMTPIEIFQLVMEILALVKQYGPLVKDLIAKIRELIDSFKASQPAP